MISLPEEFISRMKSMLGEDFSDFMESYENPRQMGLRANTLKIQPEKLKEKLHFSLEPISWTPDGFYYEGNQRPAQHPYYSCGLYYLQEPSAMTPASLLPIQPGDFVLDLCAAPGGKATKLGAGLKGKGLLVANDLSTSRARALLRNVELFGISNALITNETPARLSGYFPDYFNKILVDAPCSGEGMFRKDPAVAGAWTPDKPAQCAAIQREILSRAVEMLMPGGLLLYSTCTFAPEENEGSISYVLENFPEMEVLDLPCPSYFDRGNPQWGNGSLELSKTIRIWPHHARGEGHFIALLQKKGTAMQPFGKAMGHLTREQRTLLEGFFCDIPDFSLDAVEIRKDKVYLLPPLDINIKGIQFLRNGLYLGDLKKNRFEPSQQLALALKPGEYKNTIRLSSDDQRISRYLRGETLLIKEGESSKTKGWHLLCVDGYPLGWGKLVNGILKNKYPAGWRKSE